MNRRYSFFLSWLLLAQLGVLIAQPQRNVLAAANLTVTPITWNIIGLDSNNVSVGPNHFPIGARVCNTGDAIASNVKSAFVWDSSDAFINLRSGTLSAYTSNGTNLSPGACTDFYYEVEVTRNSSAYNHTRRYHITATADGGLTGSTPTPRELFVEHLVSQSRNTVSDVRLDGVSIPNGGTMSLLVGNTYTIQLVGSTATNGYEQIETFINIPNTIFRVNSVSTTYTAPSPTTTNRLYADACTWENDPNSPNYRSCLGVGKNGGNITVTYQVTILQAPSAPLVNPQPLSTLIYDFSGSSYHYNADYGTSTRYAYIFDPSQITIAKNFNPDPTTVSGISTLTFTLTNPTSVAVSGLNFTDTLPTTPGAMVVANPTNASTTGCGSPTFAPSAGAGSISFSNGTVAANSTCTIKVNVTVPVAGTYNNTSSNLFINSLNTGNNASDSLTVNSTPPGPSPVCGLTMAQWTFAGFTTNPPPFPSANTQASNVATAAISVGNGMTAEADTTASGGFPQPGIRLYGWQKDPPIVTGTSAYIQFAIDTSKYTAVNLQFDAQRKANGPNNDELFYSTDGTTWTSKSTFISTTAWTNFGAYNFTGQTNTTGTTYFRIYGYGANATSSGNDLNLDNVTFTGCATPVPPTITKAFSPDPIAVNGTSTLTFTLSNSNSIALTGVTFTDTLPTGLQVASTPAAATTCGGSPTWAPSAGATALAFGSPTGGTISANSSCTVSVNVTATASGSYQNISGFISSTNGGTNSGSTGSATASLTVLRAPSIAKLFSPNPILTNGTSTLTFTITNPNLNNALTGVAFSDTYPIGVTNTSTLTTSNTCGGTLTANANGGSVSLSGVSLPAGSSCTVTINVTSTSAGSYANTSIAVSSTNGGTGNTASDTLIVESPNPSIALLKQISTSPTGPWTSYVTVTPGTNVYYQFTIENTGDVALSPVSVSDPNVSTAGCSWPASLPVAVSGNDSHIATCVVGPIAATSGTHINTATASGTYNGTPYTSTSSSARYSTPAISLVKSVTETSFTLVGDVLHYSYLVTNSGFAPLLSPVTVTDNKTTVTCPGVSTVGDNDNFFDPGESLTCTATYTIVLADLTAGSVTNTASAAANGVTSNTDSETVFRSIADLVVTKSNNVGGMVATGNSFDWTITVNNTGVAVATFAGGNVILTDSLPGIAGYYPQGSLTVTNGGIAPVGTINCSISGTTLSCTASGLLVTLPVGGSFSVTFTVTPAAAGTLINIATVDPNGDILELNETNNSSTNTVTVGAPNLIVAKSNGGSFITAGGTTTYTVGVGNNGDTASTGLITVVDVLPTGLSIADGAVTLGGANAADWSCNAASNVITCTSTTSIPSNNGSLFSFTLNVASNASGTLTNRIQVGGGGDPTNPNPPTTTTVGQCTGTGIPNEGCYVDTDTVNVVNLGLAKSNSTTTVIPGGTTTYTQTVTNSGNTASSGTITIVDVLPTGLTIPDGAITEGGVNAANWTCTAVSNVITCTSSTAISGSGGTSVFNFTVNVDASASGTLINRAQVGGGGDPTNPNPPTSVTAGQCTGTNTPNEGCATDSDTVDAQPAIALTKTANPLTVTAAGDTVAYTFSVENTGNVTLTNIALSDTLLSGLSCTPIASLAPGASQSFVCTGNIYTVTQTDIDNNGGGDGDIDNTATATGAPPSGGSVSDTDDEAVTLPAPNPSLTLTKTANPLTVTAPGDTVTYTFSVQNTGNVTLTNITLTDTLLSGLSCTPIASLVPGVSQSFTCTGNAYTVTQADIDNNGGGDGDIDNTATATGMSPGGGSISDTDAKAVTLPAHNPSLTLTKTANPTSVTTAGDTVTYTFLVQNTGNVTLTNITLSDTLLSGLSCTAIGSVSPAASQSFTCTGNTYAVTQSDIDNDGGGDGDIDNTATATGSPPSGGSVNDTDSEAVTIVQNPLLNIVKEVAIAAGGPWNDISVTVNVGDIVFYRVRVANTGNITLTNLVVDDGMASCTLVRATDVTGDNDNNFEVGEEWAYTCSVTALAGTNNNTATADTTETPQDSDTASYFGSNPAFTIAKTPDLASVNAAGNVITYTITLTNTGNIALTGVSVSDPLLVDLDCDGTTGVPLVTTGLTINSPGTLTCSGTYTVTQTDLDINGGGDGDIDNTVIGDTNETSSQSTSAAVTINRNLAHTTAKAPTSTGPYVVGNTITYDIVVTNSGNVTLTGVTIVDNSAALGACTPAQPSTLAPSATMTCPASHVVTQTDVDNGSYANTATGDSIETTSSNSTVTVTFLQTPSLNIIKEVSTDNTTWLNSVTVTVGDNVYFRARVSNTGNITLTGLTVTDPMCTLVRGTDLTGDNDGNFEVGEEWLYTCSISAVAGTNNNTATADSSETGADTDDASYTGNAIPAPAMNVTKDGALDMTVVAPNGQADAGDLINYTVAVQNTGNTALTGVIVSDPMLGDLDCDGTTGAPFTTTGLTINIGTTLTCVGSYALTQNDLDTDGGGDGDIDNTAMADSNETGQDSDPNEEALPLAPGIDVIKALNSATFNSPNEVRLTYTITVQNTGNVTLSNVQVTDDLVAAFPGAASFSVFSVTSVDFTINPAFNGNTDINLLTGTDSLAVGASGAISLVVDVDTGGDEDFYINTAVGSGDAPNGTTVQDTGVASAPGFVDPALTKAASVAQASVGDTVTFTITVTNQGNTPAPNVVVTDTLPAMFDVTAVNISVAGPALVPVVNVTPAIGVGPAPYTVTVNIGTLQVTNVVTIQIVTIVNSLGNPPVVNNASLTTTALTNNLLNDNDSVTITLGIGPTTSLSLPSTGFAPNRVTSLPAQSKESQYAAADVILEIPRLGVKMPIVGVPFKQGGWDVSWLGNQAGWLEGSAFPSWSGNSVLTGHVYSANGSPGPFLNLSTLKYGDQIIVHTNGQQYIFEIRSNTVVSPTDASAFRHEELSWLTLITCKEYDSATNTYKKRVVVRAVLVSVK